MPEGGSEVCFLTMGGWNHRGATAPAGKRCRKVNSYKAFILDSIEEGNKEENIALIEKNQRCTPYFLIVVDSHKQISISLCISK